MRGEEGGKREELGRETKGGGGRDEIGMERGIKVKSLDHLMSDYHHSYHAHKGLACNLTFPL